MKCTTWSAKKSFRWWFWLLCQWWNRPLFSAFFDFFISAWWGLPPRKFLEVSKWGLFLVPPNRPPPRCTYLKACSSNSSSFSSESSSSSSESLMRSKLLSFRLVPEASLMNLSSSLLIMMEDRWRKIFVQTDTPKKCFKKTYPILVDQSILFCFWSWFGADTNSWPWFKCSVSPLLALLDELGFLFDVFILWFFLLLLWIS